LLRSERLHASPAKEKEKPSPPLGKAGHSHPSDVAFLAMTQHRLGQKDEARTTLARLREIMKAPTWAANEEAKAFLREATQLIEGSAAQPKP
jgi:hypothetical protein